MMAGGAAILTVISPGCGAAPFVVQIAIGVSAALLRLAVPFLRFVIHKGGGISAKWVAKKVVEASVEIAIQIIIRAIARLVLSEEDYGKLKAGAKLVFVTSDNEQIQVPYEMA